MALTDPSADCSGAFPLELSLLFNTLQVPNSSCACGCGQPTVTCPNSMTVIGFDELNCVTGMGQHTIAPNQCYSKTTESHQLVVSGPQATCTSGTVSPNIGATSWEVSRRACAATKAALTCANLDDVCVSAPGQPFEPAICVFRPGTHSCPPGYPNQTVYFENVSDTRSCPNSCACKAEGGVCQVSVESFSGTSCTGLTNVGKVNSTNPWCGLQGGIMSIRPSTPTILNAGFCQPTDPPLTGTATPEDPITVCCM